MDKYRDIGQIQSKGEATSLWKKHLLPDYRPNQSRTMGRQLLAFQLWQVIQRKYMWDLVFRNDHQQKKSRYKNQPSVMSTTNKSVNLKPWRLLLEEDLACNIGSLERFSCFVESPMSIHSSIQSTHSSMYPLWSWLTSTKSIIFGKPSPLCQFKFSWRHYLWIRWPTIRLTWNNSSHCSFQTSLPLNIVIRHTWSRRNTDHEEGWPWNWTSVLDVGSWSWLSTSNSGSLVGSRSSDLWTCCWWREISSDWCSRSNSKTIK